MHFYFHYGGWAKLHPATRTRHCQIATQCQQCELCASSTYDGLINTATTRISIKTRQIWMMKLAMAQKIFPMGDAVSMAIHFVRIFTLLLENYNLWNFIIVFLRLKKNYSLLKDVSSGNLSQIPILVFWTKTMITQSWTMFQTSDKPVILSKTLWFNSIYVMISVMKLALHSPYRFTHRAESG